MMCTAMTSASAKRSHELRSQYRSDLLGRTASIVMDQPAPCTARMSPSSNVVHTVEPESALDWSATIMPVIMVCDMTCGGGKRVTET